MYKIQIERLSFNRPRTSRLVGFRRLSHCRGRRDSSTLTRVSRPRATVHCESLLHHFWSSVRGTARVLRSGSWSCDPQAPYLAPLRRAWLGLPGRRTGLAPPPGSAPGGIWPRPHHATLPGPASSPRRELQPRREPATRGVPVVACIGQGRSPVPPRRPLVRPWGRSGWVGPATIDLAAGYGRFRRRDVSCWLRPPPRPRVCRLPFEYESEVMVDRV